MVSKSARDKVGGLLFSTYNQGISPLSQGSSLAVYGVSGTSVDDIEAESKDDNAVWSC